MVSSRQRSSCFQPSAVRLSPLPLCSTQNVKQGMMEMMPASPSSHWLLLIFRDLVNLLDRSPLTVSSDVVSIPALPAYRSSVSVVLSWWRLGLHRGSWSSCCLRSILRAWSGLPLLMIRCCFSSRSFSQVKNAWASSQRMKSAGNPTTACRTKCLMAAANSLFNWILAMS